MIYVRAFYNKTDPAKFYTFVSFSEDPQDDFDNLKNNDYWKREAKKYPHILGGSLGIVTVFVCEDGLRKGQVSQLRSLFCSMRRTVSQAIEAEITQSKLRHIGKERN